MNLLSTVSSLPLSFGGAAISGEGGGYGFGSISENSAIELLKMAYEMGLRIFDSAPIYGYGLSEKRMGKAFSNMREKVFLISKCGVTWHENRRVDMSNDPEVVKKMFYQSLKDFGDSYIDLYMVHWPDKNVDIRRVMEVLAKFKEQGLINHIGLCNTFKEDYLKAKEIDQIEVIQGPLNIFEREKYDEIKDIVIDDDLSFMSYGTLDKGIITGHAKIGRVYEKSDARSFAPWWKKSNYKERIARMEKVFPKLEERNITPIQLALSFNLQYAHNCFPLCGMRNIEQLTTAINAVKHPIDLKVVNDILRDV